ncbi:DUF2059 domain-containing protein [Marinobacter sp. M3C]|jgi:hypothetical protein|uniref:DUF2059 domain-containing protein n=1 Tax=unclassified Marinobacter TaxID=83889 RepID=UPI00200D1031|nr:MULTISPECIES: DUF2059 domain-containing protein [unclassified Marinobacter]MCL1480506.1 DUF2059 domain-containing protein [Marinobacter sp.]MCL1487823.1 DUF2059 domain-containing protein [Marinobacter sp.]UQG56288.1 DUF2059 domain-containing protein [Marinobacter sp. M4C]UQG58440.1 DUF2059 domain-containing protein [Marinobacter sp. M3C]UQG65092.1 DUF2059 domain-containing protein [Marinobacter sp. M2C]
MIKHQYKLLSVAIILFVSSLSYADVSDESINKLLDLSGLTIQVDQFPDLIKAGMEQAKQQGTPIPDAEYSSMVNSADESIVPSEIIEGIRVSLKQSINEKETQKLLAWYESDLGKEITHAEESASTPEAYHQMMQSAPSLLANPERVEFANRLDVLLGATDMTMGIQEHTGIAVYSAIMTAMQPGTPLNVEPFKAQMDAASVQTRAAVKQMVTISLLYSYKNIRTNNLRKYETFLNDSTTMKFNKTIMGSMNRELESSISKWANILAHIFRNKKQQS